VPERKRQVTQDHRAELGFPWASGGFFASCGLGEHAHDVAFLHDQIVDAIDLDLGTGPFTEQNLWAKSASYPLPRGDSVDMLQPWTPPKPFDGVTNADAG
jgi:hypothetical protein